MKRRGPLVTERGIVQSATGVVEPLPVVRHDLYDGDRVEQLFLMIRVTCHNANLQYKMLKK